MFLLYKMKIYHFLNGSIICCLLFLMGCSLHSPDKIEQVLLSAGPNRSNLVKVLDHYSLYPQDSLKLKAAKFLIANMPGKVSSYGQRVDEFHHFIDSVYQIKQVEYDIPDIYKTFLADAQYQDKKILISQDLETISSDYLIKNIEDAFEVWQKPWASHLSLEDFCEYILPYRVQDELLESWRPIYKQKFADLLTDTVRTAKDACTLINNNLIGLPIHIAHSTIRPSAMRPSSLLNIKFGICDDYAMYAVLAMRGLGIPVAIESVPHWGKSKGGHVFNVVYNNDGQFLDFAGAEQNPGEHLVRFKKDIPKVYRQMFGYQSESLAMIHGDEPIPEIFMNPCIKDVTANYPFINATDLVLSLPEAYPSNKYAYLCVFDRNGWFPIAWGKVKNRKAYFLQIGTGIVYQLACCVSNGINMIGEPFLLDSLGQVTYYEAKKTRKTFCLERKNPLADHLKWIPASMIGGKFQGANLPDFRDAEDVYSINEAPNFKYIETPISSNKTYRYFRYLSSDQTNGNMAEIEVYSKGQIEKCTGQVVGDYTPSIYYPRNTADKMFDGDPLSFFHTADTLGWGGLMFEQPICIDRIRYIIRNDDNGIRKGHEYELKYMQQGRWVSVERKQAETDDLILFSDVPEGALYWLIDHTKGTEERIFSYENNIQCWH